MSRLCAAVQTVKIDVAIEVAELDRWARSTPYRSLVFIERDGGILGKHRKEAGRDEALSFMTFITSGLPS